MRRLERSVSTPWRLSTTGIESLNLSATCWASLKLLGMTRCTRTSPRPLPPRTERRTVVAPAAASAQAADVGALARALLGLRLGLVGLVLVAVGVRVALLGEAEVDQ